MAPPTFCSVNLENPKEYSQAQKEHGKRMTRGGMLLNELVKKGLATENEPKLFKSNVSPYPCKSLAMIPVLDKLEALTTNAAKLTDPQKTQVKNFMTGLFISQRSFTALNSEMDALLKSVGVKPGKVSKEARLIEDLTATVTPLTQLPPQMPQVPPRSNLPQGMLQGGNQQAYITSLQGGIKNQTQEIATLGKGLPVGMDAPNINLKLTFGAEFNELTVKIGRAPDGGPSNTLFKFKPNSASRARSATG